MYQETAMVIVLLYCTGGCNHIHHIVGLTGQVGLTLVFFYKNCNLLKKATCNHCYYSAENILKLIVMNVTFNIFYTVETEAVSTVG